QINEFEKKYPLIEFKENIKDIFRESDILSLHIPLNIYTENFVNRNLLKLMKRGALLINTARGGILDLDALLDMLENKEIQINIAFDVFPIEPIESKTLERLKNIKKRQPGIRMILIPHNASADANTRAKMDILFLEDIIKIIRSSSLEDLKEIHIIPEHKKQLKEKKWRIFNYWGKKMKMIRSFIAIELKNKETIENILSFTQRLKQNQPKIKLVEPVNLHMTMKFLGNIPETQAPKIYSILQEEINGKLFHGKKLEYSLKGVGQFNRFSVLWIK
ncbi:unnamed protein product, partial [marine sediment metagenome]